MCWQPNSSQRFSGRFAGTSNSNPVLSDTLTPKLQVLMYCVLLVGPLQECGRLWKSNPANFMTLPLEMQAVDVDNSGTIDASEFKDLLMRSGHRANAAKLFAQLDKDGDGSLTRLELDNLLDVRRNQLKARGNH